MAFQTAANGGEAQASFCKFPVLSGSWKLSFRQAVVAALVRIAVLCSTASEVCWCILCAAAEDDGNTDHVQANAEVYLPYAKFLLAQDKFDEARQAYDKVGRDSVLCEV